MSYLLAAIFLLVPLAFSHFFLLLSIPVTFEHFGAYEGLKIAVATCILLIAILYRGFFADSKRFFKGQGGLLIAWGSMVMVFLVHIFQWAKLSSEFFGTPPFLSGFFWMLLLLFLLALASQLPKNSLRPLEISGAIALLLVVVYAGMQWAWYDPISYDIPFESDRVFSTLWNPNSYAIYCLLFLPYILLGNASRWKWCIALLLFVAIAISASFSIFFLAGACIAWCLCYEAGAPKSWYIFCFVVLGMSYTQWWLLQWEGGDKFLSLMTRFAIWGEGIEFVITHPLALVWWAPQTDMVYQLNELRSSHLEGYIPMSYTILHLHNTWFDLLVQFGLVGIFGIWYGLAKWYRKNFLQTTTIVRATVILFCFSGLLHRLDFSHWCVLVLVIVLQRYSHIKIYR